MKRTLRSVHVVMIMLLSMTLALPALAQHDHQHRAKDEKSAPMEGHMMDTPATPGGHAEGMMSEGMMHNHMEAMMSRPLYRTLMLTHVLPSMAEALSLTQEQVAELQRLQNALNENVQQISENVGFAEEGLDEALAEDPSKVRATLRSLASRRADMQVLAYDAVMEMKSVLTPEQVSRLEGMTPVEVHQAVMSSPDHMQMMQSMKARMMGGMDCPMMAGGMMSGAGGMAGPTRGIAGE